MGNKMSLLSFLRESLVTKGVPNHSSVLALCRASQVSLPRLCPLPPWISPCSHLSSPTSRMPPETKSQLPGLCEYPTFLQSTATDLDSGLKPFKKTVPHQACVCDTSSPGVFLLISDFISIQQEAVYYLLHCLALHIGGEVWNLKSTESRKQETTEDQGWAQPEGPCL